MATAPLKSSAAQQLVVTGSWGQFGGTGGSPRVFYLQTVVSPGNAGTPECELSELLVPVREVFDLEKLTFDQILQRDLDDHRVATGLIPYLLDRPDIPKFFPPILAVIVPFEKNKVRDDYGARKEEQTAWGSDGTWKNDHMEFPGLFDFVRPYEVGPGQHARSGAELRFNRQGVKLMVVDGQHRAMALLAIQRNLLNLWEKTRGDAYKHFYREIDLEKIPSETLQRIELPVCICFFPDATPGAGGMGLQQICRKIFLDVNREARAPSASRNILMDDYDLRAVFTRAVFSAAKDHAGGEGGLQLRHVEYDNPNDKAQVEKGIALTNVTSIENAIEWLLVRPDGNHTDLTWKTTKGRFKDNNTRLQRVLRLADRFSDTDLAAWGLDDVTQINVRDFPLEARDKLSEAFREDWGAMIVRFFSDYLPYQRHIAAVDEVYTKTADAGQEFRLARQGLFEGQGLYHTLEASAQKRAEQRRTHPSLAKSASETAWTQVQLWLKEVYQRRADLLLDRKSKPAAPDEVKKVTKAMDTLRSQAFQIGALMAMAYLAQQLGLEEIAPAAGRWIKAASAPWARNAERQLRMFDRMGGDGLAGLYGGSVDPGDWRFYRYCFLEQVRAGASTVDDLDGLDEVRAAVDEGRAQFVERRLKVIKEEARKNSLKTTEAKMASQARDAVYQALKNSLGVTRAEFDASLAQAKTSEGDDDEEDVVNSDTDEPESADET